ncbi:MAG: response regulator [Halobacterium sp.]
MRNHDARHRAADAAPDGGAAADASNPEPGDSEGVVLVVDDDEEFAETVRLWFEPEWTTILAHDGDEAVDAYGPHVDVVLLDRRMPSMSGGEALERIREQDGDARVAILTAVGPDWDIVDMDFDMYLEKPLTREDVVDAVEELSERATYVREVQALYSLSTKLALLQDRFAADDLRDDDRYQRLLEEFDRLYEQTADRIEELDDTRFRELMQVVDEAPNSANLDRADNCSL